MAGAMKLAAVCMVLACMVVATANAAITCITVTSKIAPCIPYVTIKALTAIPVGCCGGIAGLFNMARTTPDRRQVCRCLKAVARILGSSLDLSRAAGLPGACHVTVPFPISLNTNCDTVR